MYNEDMVAERVIDTTCQIDYPLDKLEIQVLDDSTDHSAEIARRACEEWAAKGYPDQVHPPRQPHRLQGRRAGRGIEAAPPASSSRSSTPTSSRRATFFDNVVDYFTDDKIGMVQVRWDHLNRDASLLTKGQAIFLDGHFVIEHTARNRSGRFMHFNGTAGVWRRKTIDDAGGWQHDTLTEDLDLSAIAPRCKGWQFVYLPQFCAPAELPPEMIGFKQQAHRWTKGSVQTAIKLLPKILRSEHLPLRHQDRGVFPSDQHHRLSADGAADADDVSRSFSAIYSDCVAPLKQPTWGQFLFSVSLFILATCSASTFFVFGQRELFGKEAGWKTLLYLPFLMGLGVGIGLNNAKAVFEAIWAPSAASPANSSARPSTASPARVTPSGATPRVLTLKPTLAAHRRDRLRRLHVALHLDQPLVSASAMAAIPFLLIFAGGYFYVGFASLHALWKMNKEAELEADAALPEVIIAND